MRKEIITNNDPKSPISEVFRSLRTNMQYMGSKKKLTILVTSTMQGEGKSFIATNLAVTFAQAGKKTIIVDTDMRRPRQHKIFEIDMAPGLSNYLSGVNLIANEHEIVPDECIYKTNIENLSIFPAGNVPPNPSELLLSGKLKELINDLEERFDVIILDKQTCLCYNVLECIFMPLVSFSIPQLIKTWEDGCFKRRARVPTGTFLRRNRFGSVWDRPRLRHCRLGSNQL